MVAAGAQDRISFSILKGSVSLEEDGTSCILGGIDLQDELSGSVRRYEDRFQSNDID
jgi:hypothetical protein